MFKGPKSCHFAFMKNYELFNKILNEFLDS